MRRRINKVRQASKQHLEQETTSIEAYYQQLIEEARNQSRRWTTRLEEREDRVRWLQLEWKRRIEEANLFWRPQVNARLVALGLQMVPRVAYRYGVAKVGGRKTARTGPVRVWDEATKTLLLPYCSHCGKTDLEGPEIGPEGEFVCADCAALPPETTEAKCARRTRGKGRAKKTPQSLTLVDAADSLPADVRRHPKMEESSWPKEK
jgi:hypothetical protein